jgi:hypothetical protein
MPFRTSGNTQLGQQPFTLAGVDTVPQVPLGTTIRGFDPLLGEGEFIYLSGQAGMVAGDVVVYDLSPSGVSVTRLSHNVPANSGRPVAVAVVPVLAGQFGWYQIGGCAIVSAVAGTVAGVMMATSTAGSVGNPADPGDQILGARFSSAVGTPSANKAYATLNRPHLQGQIT